MSDVYSILVTHPGMYPNQMDCTRDSLWTCGTAVNQKRCVRTILVNIYIYSKREHFLRFYLNLARKTRIFSALLIRGSLGNAEEQLRLQL